MPLVSQLLVFASHSQKGNLLHAQAPPTWKNTLDRLGLVLKKLVGTRAAKPALHARRMGIEPLETRSLLATVSIGADVSSLAEDASGASFIVSRDDTSGPLTVSFGVGGSATNGTDYTSLSGSVTIPDGESSAIVTLTPFDDGDAEGDEDVVLTLQGGNQSSGCSSSLYTINSNASQATVTILDDDVDANPPVFNSSAAAGVPENSTSVLDLSATDPENTAVTFAISGGADAAFFSLDTNTNSLSFQAAPDFELPANLDADNVYQVQVTATDGVGNATSQLIDVTVLNANEAPTSLTLSSSSVDENLPAGTVVGILSATDPDAGDTHAFTLVAGAGDADNGAFQIVGNELQTSALFDFETKSSYSIRVQAVDGGNQSYEQEFIVSVHNVEEIPPNIVTISVSQSEVAEGDTPSLVFERSDSTGELTVYFVLDVTSTASANDLDGSLPGSITFLAGESTASLPLSISDDLEAEQLEALVFNLTYYAFGPVPYVIGDPGSATISIAASDAAPLVTVSIEPAGANENIASGKVEFTVRLSGATTVPVTVQFATSDGSALAGSDYDSGSGTITIAAGDTTGVVEVVLINDVRDEPDQQFSVTLSNPVNAVLSTTNDVANGTILDEDPIPTLFIADVTLDESAGVFEFLVGLSAPSEKPVSVAYVTADGGATAGLDYTSNSGTLTFTPEQTIAYIYVAVHENTRDEYDEVFFVNLSAPTNVELDRNRARGTILDDDAPPVLSISDDTRNEADGSFQFTISISEPTDKYVSVDWAVAHGDTAADDFTQVSGSAAFVAGESLSRTISIPIANDGLDEVNEDFRVVLSNAANAVLFTTEADGRILDDDNLLPIASQSDREGTSVSLLLEGNTANYSTGSGIFYATGLPSGLSISPTFGTIEGKIAFDAFEAQPNGLYHVTVELKDPSGTVLSTVNFDWTVSNASIAELTGRQWHSGVQTSSFLTVTGLTTDELYYSAGNTVRLVLATPNSLPPDRADVLYTVTGLPGGNFGTTPEIAPGDSGRTVTVGIDLNQNETLDPGEETHSLVLTPINLNAVSFASQRTSGPAETQHFEILSSEHFEVGGTFSFEISPQPGADFGESGLVRYRMFHPGEDISVRTGSGLTFSHTFDASDVGPVLLRVYVDANDDGIQNQFETGFNSEMFYVLQRKVFNISVDVSNKIPGAAAFAAGLGAPGGLFERAAELLLRKDSATDYRAAVQFNVVGGAGTVFAATLGGGARPDPVANQIEEQAKHFNAAADIVFVKKLYSHAGMTWHYSWHEIIIGYDENVSTGDPLAFEKTIAHEMGHGVGLDHPALDNDPNRVMTESWLGTQDHLTKSEALAYDS